MWACPSRVFLVPANIDLCDDHYKNLFLRASLTHLSLISRSSFHQNRYNTSQSGVNAPLVGQPALYALQDYASTYFADRVFVSFELHECRDEERRDVRDVSSKTWDRIVWSIWWWVNSEDKARAKMERLRERQRESMEPTGRIQ